MAENDTCTDGTDQPIKTKYGTVDHHLGICKGCDFRFGDGPSYDEYKNVQRKMGRHIGDGAPCHDYKIKAIYEDGGEERV
jgi:hypothetical protein